MFHFSPPSCFSFCLLVLLHTQLDRAHDQIVGPLEEFRKCHIGGVKENKKKYDKKTAKFCQAQERFLNMSSKKPGTAVVEVSAMISFLFRYRLADNSY